MSDTTKDWFSVLFDEYHARGEAMFAFSRKQVEEAFEGDLAVTWDQLQSEWRSFDNGLLVKGSVYAAFVERVDADFAAWEARQPEVRVKYRHKDYWDRPCYEVVSHDEGAPVKVGQILKDVELLPVGEAVTLHNHHSGEPGHALDIRVVYVTEVSEPSDTANTSLGGTHV
jgi:hypothetical protein